ncbi:uncharacterized protein LOC131629955 [Vicia villosa]|uniref:uncharacterized protein LOC131629955 n=1 Tax=Vicia villosa TaxID=3911 RepID=UPI00273B7D2C|nr:uncharacterized protein LOC131629955 [Vicia villosa]
MKSCSVSNLGWWEDNVWKWGLIDNIPVHDQLVGVELEELCRILEDVVPTYAGMDKIVWIGGEMNAFTVREYYKKLLLEGRAKGLQPVVRDAIKVLWKGWMPSKVKIFGWRLLMDRLATREQLMKRNIITNTDLSLCVFGCDSAENSLHLFLNCAFLAGVWKKIMEWLGIDAPLRTDCCDHFLQVMNALRNYCSPRRVAGIWMATCWCIWKQRNDIIFNNVVGDVDEIVHNVKMFTWWWLALGSKQRVLCNFYEWFHNPLVCV